MHGKCSGRGVKLGGKKGAMSSDAFVGVTRGSHLAALERLYKVINPEKVHQVGLMLDKFGLGIWASLKAKYPEVQVFDPSRCACLACTKHVKLLLLSG
jgi:hypothetical protein